MKKDMKEQELRDIFHDYRPTIADNDEFMDRLTAQMDAADAQQHAHALPLYRRFLPWAAGIAAAVAIAVMVVNWPADEEDSRREASLVQPENRRSIPDGLKPELNASADRVGMGTSSHYFSSSYDEIVNEIEQSGRQLQKAIAQL